MFHSGRKRGIVNPTVLAPTARHHIAPVLICTYGKLLWALMRLIAGTNIHQNEDTSVGFSQVSCALPHSWRALHCAFPSMLLSNWTVFNNTKCVLPSFHFYYIFTSAQPDWVTGCSSFCCFKSASRRKKEWLPNTLSLSECQCEHGITSLGVTVSVGVGLFPPALQNSLLTMSCACVCSGNSAEVCGRRVCSHPEHQATTPNRCQVFLRLPGRHGGEAWHRWPRDGTHMEN